MGNVHAATSHGGPTLVPPPDADVSENDATNLISASKNPGTAEDLHKKCKGKTIQKLW